MREDGGGKTTAAPTAVPRRFRRAHPHAFPHPSRRACAPGDLSASLVALATTLELRDADTDHHCDRVSRLAFRLGRHCGLDDAALGHLALAARFHDIGKIGIPDAVLLKPARLDEAEREVMRSHPLRGEEVLLATGREDAVPVGRLIRQHHEAWDGRGYPDGLRGEEIAIEARILCIVDGYDALTSTRPYRRPMATSAALEILSAESGRLIDPRLFDEFTGLLQAG